MRSPSFPCALYLSTISFIAPTTFSLGTVFQFLSYARVLACIAPYVNIVPIFCSYKSDITNLAPCAGIRTSTYANFHLGVLIPSRAATAMASLRASCLEYLHSAPVHPMGFQNSLLPTTPIFIPASASCSWQYLPAFFYDNGISAKFSNIFGHSHKLIWLKLEINLM